MLDGKGVGESLIKHYGGVALMLYGVLSYRKKKSYAIAAIVTGGFLFIPDFIRARAEERARKSVPDSPPIAPPAEPITGGFIGPIGRQ